MIIVKSTDRVLSGCLGRLHAALSLLHTPRFWLLEKNLVALLDVL